MISTSKIEETTQLILNAQFAYIEKEFSEYDILRLILDYSLNELGFLFRPYLCRLGIEQSNLNYKDFIPLLSAIEFIQKSTLVIDDIIDNSPLRNKLPSVYSKFGTKQAILCGEILKNTGIKLIREANSISKLNKNKIIDELEEAYFKVYKGQFFDVEYETVNNITEEQYFNMIYLTTGSFIESSLICGLILSNLPNEDLNSFRKFGQKLGMAYQLRDDIINLISDNSNGKILAEDLREKKKRLPVIHFLNNSSPSGVKAFTKLWKKEYLTDDELFTLLEMLQNADSLNYSLNKLIQLLEECNYLIDGLQKNYSILEYKELLDLIGKV